MMEPLAGGVSDGPGWETSGCLQVTWLVWLVDSGRGIAGQRGTGQEEKGHKRKVECAFIIATVVPCHLLCDLDFSFHLLCLSYHL